MTRQDFIANYIIQRAYLHNIEGLSEHVEYINDGISLQNEEDKEKIRKAFQYSDNMENEIFHAIALADIMSNYTDFEEWDTPKK